MKTQVETLWNGGFLGKAGARQSFGPVPRGCSGSGLGDVSGRACQGRVCRVQSTLQSQAFQALHAPAWPASPPYPSRAQRAIYSSFPCPAGAPRGSPSVTLPTLQRGRARPRQANRTCCWSHTGSRQLCSVCGARSPCSGGGRVCCSPGSSPKLAGRAELLGSKEPNQKERKLEACVWPEGSRGRAAVGKPGAGQQREVSQCVGRPLRLRPP